MFLPCRLSDTSLSPFVLSLSALILLPPDWYTIENSIPGVSPLPLLEAAYVIGVDCPNMDVTIDNTNSQPVILLAICFIILPVLSCFILKFGIFQIYFFCICSKNQFFQIWHFESKRPTYPLCFTFILSNSSIFFNKRTYTVHFFVTSYNFCIEKTLQKKCFLLFFIVFYFFGKRFSFFCIFFRFFFVFSCLFFHFVLTKKACASITIRYAGYLSLIYYSIVL